MRAYASLDDLWRVHVILLFIKYISSAHILIIVQSRFLGSLVANFDIAVKAGIQPTSIVDGIKWAKHMVTYKTLVRLVIFILAEMPNPKQHCKVDDLILYAVIATITMALFLSY